MAKKLSGGQYYKQKAVVLRVLDRYAAEVEVLDGGDVFRLDQDKLETVIPQVGGPVLILNGVGRGEVRLDSCARHRVRAPHLSVGAVPLFWLQLFCVCMYLCFRLES